MNITRNSVQTTLPFVAWKSSRLVLLFAATHTVSDAITNMLSALLPTLQSRFALTGTTLAMLIATLSLSALVTQPFFGALADRVGHRRVAALGVILNAVLFSLIGLVQDVYFLFALILVGGLGSAALHPAIASMARLAGGNKPEFAVSLFSAGGTLGIAIGPIIIMLLLANLGLSFTPWLMIPGILLGIWILLSTPEAVQPQVSTHNKLFDLRLFTGPVGKLAFIGILSSVSFVTFTSAMPLWLVHEHGLPGDSTLIGWTLSTFSLSAAVGGIAGGMISNRLGAKRLVVTSFFLALLPLHAIFLLEPGSPSYFAAVILAGALVNAGMPMLIVLAQDLSPRSAATAAGMMMGFSAGVAGLVYVGIGTLQESIGLAPAMMAGYLGLFVAAVVAWATIDPRKATADAPPVDNLSCLCSPCVDQNIAVFPQRTNAG